MAHQYLEDHIAAIRAAFEELVPVMVNHDKNIQKQNELLETLLAQGGVPVSVSAADKTTDTPAPAKKKVAKKKVAKKKATKKLAEGISLADLKTKVLTMVGAGGGADLTTYRKENDVQSLNSLDANSPILTKMDAFVDRWLTDNADD